MKSDDRGNKGNKNEKFDKREKHEKRERQEKSEHGYGKDKESRRQNSGGKHGDDRKFSYERDGHNLKRSSLNEGDNNRNDEESGGFEERQNDVIIGRHAVLEALRMNRELVSVMVVKGEHSKAINSLIAQCREKKIPVKEVDVRKLDSYGDSHQGVAGIASCMSYATLEDLFARAEEKKQPPFFIICDELEDPHNLGAIIRTADATGVHGVIVPSRRSAGLTTAVYKASVGAVEHIPVARVSNITQTIKQLKERGVWVYGLDMDGEYWCNTDMKGPMALVVGSEGGGISRLVKENCDFMVSLPMLGEIPSLNASVACGVVLYEISKQRNGFDKKAVKKG